MMFGKSIFRTILSLNIDFIEFFLKNGHYWLKEYGLLKGQASI